MKFVFKEREKKEILQLFFNKDIDDEGYITNASEDRVLTSEGEEITEKELGAVVKGSHIFFKSDIDSIIKLIEKSDEYASHQNPG